MTNSAYAWTGLDLTTNRTAAKRGGAVGGEMDTDSGRMAGREQAGYSMDRAEREARYPGSMEDSCKW